jgi:hypothetical protein
MSGDMKRRIAFFYPAGGFSAGTGGFPLAGGHKSVRGIIY